MQEERELPGPWASRGLRLANERTTPILQMRERAEQGYPAQRIYYLLSTLCLAWSLMFSLI